MEAGQQPGLGRERERERERESLSQDSDGSMEIGKGEANYVIKSSSKQISAVRAREDPSSSRNIKSDMISYAKRSKYSHTKDSRTKVEPNSQPVITKQESKMDIIAQLTHGPTTKRRSESQATPTNVKYPTPERSPPDTPGGRTGIG